MKLFHPRYRLLSLEDEEQLKQQVEINNVNTRLTHLEAATSILFLLVILAIIAIFKGAP